MPDKKKVTGLGGIFFKSDNPANLREWYNKHLGINAGNYGAMFEWLHADAPEKKALRYGILSKKRVIILPLLINNSCSTSW